ncbi:hypothetical protein C6P46_000928 [Rhodotorula mucilaginosa]|uniref:Phospholipid/glycerol acyltransferase domain-containing protein n=1 Tax=Rhodotorula mucilaginosa TaxID=5537 RepID=A0A9P7B920_RHOMI|nr:hypothetical protein C6P46_000928 [Rhodotorula mucilaginosa]
MAEKYSRWRDQATGVQPFLYPLPPGNEVSTVLELIAWPFGAIAGVVRTLLVVLLLVAQTLAVEGILRIFSFVPPLYSTLSRVSNAGICRTILALLGVVWINVDTIQLRKTGRSPPKVPFDPKKGDIIIANSSSYIDLLFLVFRYNATLTLPITSGAASATSAQIVGWRRVSLLRALFASGTLPQQATTSETLTELVANADGPVVIFPECTTSNNRAVLKFGDFAPTAAGEVKSARIFMLAFRYSPPTSFAPSLTHPIPTVAAPWLPIPLAHIYALTSRFVPYTLTIRRLHPSESPKQLDWSAMAETLAATARLKRVGALGWKEKAAFLEFRKLKGR